MFWEAWRLYLRLPSIDFYPLSPLISRCLPIIDSHVSHSNSPVTNKKRIYNQQKVVTLR